MLENVSSKVELDCLQQLCMTSKVLCECYDAYEIVRCGFCGDRKAWCGQCTE